MKKYILNTEDRKTLVNRIGELAGEKMRYSGMPGCAYEGMGFTVERNGDLIAADGADVSILQTLVSEGLILAEKEDREKEDPIPDEEHEQEAGEESAASLGNREAEAHTEDSVEPEADSLSISFPMEGHTAGSLRNLVNMIYSRGTLLSKAAGGSLKAEKELVDALAMENPPAEEYPSFVAEHGGLTGLVFEEDRITFTGFPMTEDPEKTKAFMELAAAMNKTAKEQKRIQAKKSGTESEKYTFRNWMVRIGMGGPESKAARSILLEKLSGHTAFRNKAEEEKWKANMKAKRAAAKAENTAE